MTRATGAPVSGAGKRDRGAGFGKEGGKAGWDRREGRAAVVSLIKGPGSGLPRLCDRLHDDTYCTFYYCYFLFILSVDVFVGLLMPANRF